MILCGYELEARTSTRILLAPAGGESEFEDLPIEDVKINDNSVPLKGFSIYTYFNKYMIQREANFKARYPNGID